MQTTTNYGLKKPELTDNVKVSDLNDNADAIDAQMKSNADAIAAHLANNAQNNNVHGLKSLFSRQQFSNFIINGDFLLWNNGNTNQWPDGWTGVQGDVSNLYGRETGLYLSSPYSVYITKVKTNSAMSIYQDITNMTIISRLIGKQISLSTNIATAISSNVYGIIICYNSENSVLATAYTPYHTGNGGFQQLTTTLTVPSNTTKIRVFGGYINTTSSHGSVYVDDVCLVQGSLPVAFARNMEREFDAHLAENVQQFKDQEILLWMGV
ncbi:MAG: hypothetical protein A4E53_02668 [Pelotomaculum sp. PtaB.Bin104]|nr:MAG: hypothetical protein A4E53_02668 [Pelotomaculum sp. PtaB.Bin104]